MFVTENSHVTCKKYFDAAPIQSLKPMRNSKKTVAYATLLVFCCRRFNCHAVQYITFKGASLHRLDDGRIAVEIPA